MLVFWGREYPRRWPLSGRSRLRRSVLFLFAVPSERWWALTIAGTEQALNPPPFHDRGSEYSLGDDTVVARVRRPPLPVVFCRFAHHLIVVLCEEDETEPLENISISPKNNKFIGIFSVIRVCIHLFDINLEQSYYSDNNIKMTDFFINLDWYSAIIFTY